MRKNILSAKLLLNLCLDQLLHAYMMVGYADLLQSTGACTDHDQLQPLRYLGTFFFMFTYVCQAVKVEGQRTGHVEHLNGESASLCQAVSRGPEERVVNGTTGGQKGSNHYTYSTLKCIEHFLCSPTHPAEKHPGLHPVGRCSLWPSRTPPAGGRQRQKSCWPAGPPGSTGCRRAPVLWRPCSCGCKTCYCTGSW